MSHNLPTDFNYDIWLQHPASGTATKVGYRVARDKDGIPMIKESLAPFVAPQISQGAYTYDSNDATVNIPVAFESWRGGCGFAEVPGSEPLARTVYCTADYIDASQPDGLMLSPKKQTGGSVSQNPIKFVYSTYGTHVMTTRYVYEWTGAAWTSRFDNTNKTNTDLIEYKNSRGTYLVLTLSDDNYYISTDGVTFSQPNSGALYPTYRSSSVVESTSSSSVVLDKPSGVAVDDVLFAAIVVYSGTVSAAPSGWTLIESRTADTPHEYHYYYRITATEPNQYVWTLNTASICQGAIAAYQGCVTSGTPYQNAVYTQAGAGASITTSNNQTCTQNDSTILTIITGGIAAGTSTYTWTTAAGYTERVDESVTDGATGALGIGIFDKVNQDVGAVSSATFTPSASVTIGFNTQYLLKPLAGSSSLNNGMRMAVRGSANGEPLLWCVDSNGGIRNTPDPTHPGMWSNADTIQFSQPVTVKGLEVVDNVFYLYTNKGIDSYDGTTIATVWNNTTLAQQSDAARPYTWVDQKTYFTFDGALLQYDPVNSVVNKLWPRGLQYSTPGRTGTITAISGDSKNLYFVLKEVTGSYYMVMKCDPNVSFTMAGESYMPVFDFIQLDTTVCNALIAVPAASDTFSSTRPQLIVGYGNNADYYIQTKGGSSPYSDTSYAFDTTANAAMYGTFIDPGARLFPKFLNSITSSKIRTDATYPINVLAYMRLTDGTEVSESHFNNNIGITTTNITTDREFTSVFPYYSMRATASTSSPVLSSAVFNTSLNPDRFRTWEITVEVDDDLERSGGGDSMYGAKYLTDHLYNGLTQRVVFFDRFNVSYVTRILDVNGVLVNGDKLLYNITLVQLQ